MKKFLLLLSVVLIGALAFVDWHTWNKKPVPVSPSPIVPSAPNPAPIAITPQPGFKLYHNAELGFEFQYPETWTFHPNTFGSPFSKFNLVGASPEENGFPDPITPSIVINIVTPDFADRAVINFKNLNASTLVTTVADIKVTKYEYEFEGLPRIAVVGLMISKDRILFGGGKKYINVFNQILTTFKFLK